MSARPNRLRLPLAAAALVLLVLYAFLSIQVAWMPSYDPEQDYAYSFSDPSTRRLTVPIDADGFVVPPSGEPWDTAIMRIRISASLFGNWLAPSIEVRVGERRVAAQHFEHGAEGLRVLDLSALSAFPRESPLKVTLHGKHLTWKPESSQILLFDNRLARPPRVMVIAPHPDDAEIAAFGLYSRYEDSRIITITAGDSGPKWYGYLLPEDAGHYAMKARLRVWDSIAIPQLGGVRPEHAVNLGYFDGTLESMFERPQHEVRAQHVDTADVMTFRKHNVANLAWLGAPRATWTNLVSDLTRLLEAAAPDLIVAPHPLLDGHPDHVYASIAVMESMAAAGLTSKLYLYGAHVLHADEFPLGPADSSVGIPPWFDPKAPFRGLHSMPLDRERQLLKLFVLEAMHDFRRGPPAPQGSPRESAASAAGSLRRLFADLVGGQATDYYRKAARPNELFFVYPGQDACALRDAALRLRGIEPEACAMKTR